ncbi:hypothetical protein KI387_038206 [Taxus chinensis]|uniref:Reverse transcriptase domain-containing protein n=1 Tax=Taxus chinensis TaxID=29808 RepID=A0AA38CE10_TAXCH|nr:hypothetical protein KI387_038206 [Taxus chinensis]
MLDAWIIFPIHHSTWVENIVPVRKKNGEICICVDFRNLNQASLKDNYPLPIMDQVLQAVTGSEMLSMLDGFSGYNQIEVSPEDQFKTAFTTPWGTFAYSRMPFGLTNSSATFQWAMDFAFKGMMGKVIVVYLDDLTVFSKQRNDHCDHLEQVLIRCREHGISLNPKKSVFRVTEGKLLGHIVSKEGTKIDAERVKAIQSLTLPTSKTGVHSFFGKVNFLRRFVPDFAEKTRHISNMMKGSPNFWWSEEGKNSFEEIKASVAHAPVLVCPNFSKDFIMYSYASEHTVSAILMQKNSEDVESPIAFMSSPLKPH